MYQARFVALVGLLTLVPTALAADLPCWLPRYDLHLRIDPAAATARVQQRVTWTNRHQRPTQELVLNVYPQYTVPSTDSLLMSKTLELLRVSGAEAMLDGAPAGQVTRVAYIGTHKCAEPLDRVCPASFCPNKAQFAAPEPPDAQARELTHHFQPALPTALVVNLPHLVGYGETVTVEIDYTIRLPKKMGRWGQWQGVTFLANWHPVLAYYDDTGWQPMPFIPWHQPFFNEAGIFRAHITVPCEQKLACSAAIRATRDLGDGWHELETVPVAVRDFAVVCSARFQEYTGTAPLPNGQAVEIKCLAFPDHEHYAREMVQIAADAIKTFSQWFGPYPYTQFTIAESFFGWNGNECGGMVLIDERIFTLPKIAHGYVDYLVTHEVCHQWWYNVVGTNGYCETFMDEGLATHCAYRLLDRKCGKNNAMIAWPRGLEFLPSVSRDNYRYAGYYGAMGRAECGPAVQSIPQFGNLVKLFNGAYDRGSKVIGLVEEKLGPDAFVDFMRIIYRKYCFRILRVSDFRTELEAYTGRSWEEFFQRWVYGAGMSDWRVDDVKVTPAKTGCYRVRVQLSQHGANHEDTVLGFQRPDQPGYAVRVPIQPQIPLLQLDDHQARVECKPNQTVQVDIELPFEPTQVLVDPDSVLVDTNPANNYWKPLWNFRLTPLYTMLDETDLTNDYDRWNVIGGLWVYGQSYSDPWYTRSSMFGARLGAYRTQHFNGGAYVGYRSDFRDVVVGVDGLIDHWPCPRTQVGFNLERRVVQPWDNDGPNGVNRAMVFARYIFHYGSSYYLPPMQYLETFGAYQDNFLPFVRGGSRNGAVRPDHTTVGGLHYRLDLRTPYWDPEQGVRVDATVASGSARLAGDDDNYNHLEGAVAWVQKGPESWGWFGDTRFATRVYGITGVPNRGQYFALGGGTLFRGFDLAERQGSALWVANLETRVPLLRNVEYDLYDRLAGLRNVYLAGFYDLGECYARGNSQNGVAHALGVGLRLDFAVCSFLERVVVRFDMAKALNANTPIQFWLGVNQPF
jgi:hypothetical protein